LLGTLLALAILSLVPLVLRLFGEQKAAKGLGAGRKNDVS